MHMPTVLAWTVVATTLGFVVFTVESCEENRAALSVRVRSGIVWPFTVLGWAHDVGHTSGKFFRAVMNTWLLVTMTWLIHWEYDRLGTSWAFLAAAWATPAFIVYCVDRTSSDLRYSRGRRARRAVLWFTAFNDYMGRADTIPLVMTTAMCWLTLMACWLASSEWDMVGSMVRG